MSWRSWNSRQPHERDLRPLKNVCRRIHELDILHNEVHLIPNPSIVSAKMMDDLGNARRICLLILRSIFGDVKLCCDFRPERVGVIEFCEVICADEYGGAVVVVPLIHLLVFSASFYDSVLEIGRYRRHFEVSARNVSAGPGKVG